MDVFMKTGMDGYLLNSSKNLSKPKKKNYCNPLCPELVNHTQLKEFILIGLSTDGDLQLLLFILFLTIYTVSLAGNLMIIMIITISASLHSPMYFFLCNLSFLDIGFVSVTLPKMLAIFLQKTKTIAFSNCIAQVFFFIFFAGTECLLLSVMAIDRYVAICFPLRYTIIMNLTMCFKLAAFSWLCGFINSLIHTILISKLFFCSPSVIDHFTCDIPPLLKLSCVDTSTNELLILLIGVFLGMTSVLITIVSYVYIISSIISMSSAGGRKKTFSTCGAHLTCVILFYGTATFRYMRPASSYSLHIYDKLLSVLYSISIPMLNPVIYCLRNNEVKCALKKRSFAFIEKIQCCKSVSLIKVKVAE
ncbi:olfactory receptor 5AR1-like [Lissotriton helveticus]